MSRRRKKYAGDPVGTIILTVIVTILLAPILVPLQLIKKYM